jgi:RNA polymerase sigma factor (sigma-70 family)
MKSRTDVEHLVVQYLPMVRSLAWSIARKFPQSCQVDDLVGEGVLALVECTARFDSERGTTFGAFARPRAHGAMWDHVQHQCGWLSRKQKFAEDLMSEHSGPECKVTDAYLVSQDLREFISKMPRRYRMVLEEDLHEDVEPVTKHFGVSRKTVLRWKQDAIATLQSQMSAA